MGNVLQGFVNAGGMNTYNPAQAVNNALSAKAAKQATDLNALKIRDYETDRKAAQDLAKTELLFKSITAGLSLKDPAAASAFVEKMTGEKINFSGTEQQVTIMDDSGLKLTGPRADVMMLAGMIGSDGKAIENPEVWNLAQQKGIIVDFGEQVEKAEKIRQEGVAAESAKATQKTQIDVANIGARSRESVAQTNAMSKMQIKQLDQEIKKVTADAKIPPNVQAAIKVLNNYKENSSSSAFEQVLANALSGNTQDTSIIAAGRQELSGAEQTIYDQAVKTVYDYFSGQSAAAGITPVVGKVYVDANGNKAKYLGPGQWETIP